MSFPSFRARWPGCLIVVGLAVSAAAQTYVPKYQAPILMSPPSGDLGPYDVNVLRQFVGAALFEGGSDRKPAYWPSPSATPIQMRYRSGQKGSGCNSINDSGVIVGDTWSSATYVAPYYWPAPVYWQRYDQPQIPMWCPTILGSAVCINNQGNVVGYSQDSSSTGKYTPLFWPSPSAHFIRLQAAPEPVADSIWAIQINESGVIIGNTGDVPGFRAVLW